MLVKICIIIKTNELFNKNEHYEFIRIYNLKIKEDSLIRLISLNI